MIRSPPPPPVTPPTREKSDPREEGVPGLIGGVSGGELEISPATNNPSKSKLSIKQKYVSLKGINLFFFLPSAAETQ